MFPIAKFHVQGYEKYEVAFTGSFISNAGLNHRFGQGWDLDRIVFMGKTHDKAPLLPFLFGIGSGDE